MRRVRHTHVFWIAVFLVALVASIAIASTYRLISQYNASSRSQRIVLELDRFLSHLKDIETGTRGYALTRDARFLEPYSSGRANVRLSLAQLRELAIGEVHLSKHINDLQRVAQRREAMSNIAVRRVSAGANPSEIREVMTAGKAAMDEARREVRSVAKSQERIAADRRRTIEDQAVVAAGALGLGVTFSVLVLAWLFQLLKRENNRRREAEGKLRLMNNELEDRVEERTAEVVAAQTMLKAIVENLPDTVFLKDPEDEFRYSMINKAGEKLFGLQREEILGHIDHELFPNEAPLCRQEDRQTLESSGAALVTERAFAAEEGSRVIELRKVPLVLTEEGKKFVLGIARDVTERKTLEAQVREMQRLEAVGLLTGGIAHDFNNLLAVIMGNVELVREQLADESDAAALTDEAVNAVQRGADLVRRLLAFARKQHLEPVAVNLNERLPAVTPLLKRTLGESIRFQVKAADDLWSARIDPTQFDDALVNMAINARDAMPDGGTLTIETANAVLDEEYASHHAEVKAGDYVMLAVSDTGVGMSTETVSRAFEPFYTTKGEGKGTGLGLSQVFGWVKQSGGHIKIYSELGHGTTVKLYLPRSGADAAQQEPSTEDVDIDGTGRILLVEDNPNVRQTALRQLTDLGYEVIESEDAQAALEKIRSSVEFDLLLTDVVMPGGMNGYELAAEAKNIRPGIKVLFTSGYTELAATGRETGRSGPLISKPYTKKALGRVIRSVLRNGDEEVS